MEVSSRGRRRDGSALEHLVATHFTVIVLAASRSLLSGVASVGRTVEKDAGVARTSVRDSPDTLPDRGLPGTRLNELATSRKGGLATATRRACQHTPDTEVVECHPGFPGGRTNERNA